MHRVPVRVRLRQRLPVHSQTRAALRYLQNLFVQERITKLPDRAESVRGFNHPYAAIEEATAAGASRLAASGGSAGRALAASAATTTRPLAGTRGRWLRYLTRNEC